MTWPKGHPRGRRPLNKLHIQIAHLKAEGKTVKEIAEITGKTTTAVNHYWFQEPRIREMCDDIVRGTYQAIMDEKEKYAMEAKARLYKEAPEAAERLIGLSRGQIGKRHIKSEVVIQKSNVDILKGTEVLGGEGSNTQILNVFVTQQQMKEADEGLREIGAGGLLDAIEAEEVKELGQNPIAEA